MQEMLLVNPGRQTRKRNPRKRRSPAQKAATRKLVALNKRRGGSRKRRRNPAPPGTTAKRRRNNPRRRRVGRAFTQRNIMEVSTAAVGGAAGAILLDVVLGFLPLPAMFKVGIPGKVAKAAGAIALGAVVNMSGFARPGTARDMTIGALTVQFAGIGRDMLGQFAPGIALSRFFLFHS